MCRVIVLFHCRYRIYLLNSRFVTDVALPSGWFHVVMNYLGPEDGQGIRAYHNGVLIGSDNTTGSGTSSLGNGIVAVGKYPAENDGNYANVDMDELMFFNQILTDQSILDVMNMIWILVNDPLVHIVMIVTFGCMKLMYFWPHFTLKLNNWQIITKRKIKCWRNKRYSSNGHTFQCQEHQKVANYVGFFYLLDWNFMWNAVGYPFSFEYYYYIYVYIILYLSLANSIITITWTHSQYPLTLQI